VSGLDDHTAICVECSGLMLRPDEEVFGAYFEDISTLPSAPELLPKI
jgi:hypothetical protein